MQFFRLKKLFKIKIYDVVIIVPVFKDLLACLSSSEVQQMLDELASDPDDKHVPPSVRLG